MVGLIGSSAIMFVVLYATHGFSARTSTALVGTLFGLILIAALGYAATRWAHLTGVAAEDDYVLAAAAPDLRLTSVVLCGIIVAGLGVLNDVTITQASAVWELADQGHEPAPPLLPGDADRPGPHRVHRLHDRLRHGRRQPLGAAADRHLRPAAAPGPADRAVRRAGDRDVGRLDRPGAGGAADHRRRRGGGPGQPQLGTPAARPPAQPSTGRRPARGSRAPRWTASVEPDPIDSTPAEAETGLLPATKWRAQGHPHDRTARTRPRQSPSPDRRHRSRRRDDDDFGDFTYLRDPTDTDPGGPTGRRSR